MLPWVQGQSAKLVLPSIELAGGATAVGLLRFTPGEQPITALQFDLEADFSAIELFTFAGDGVRQTGKSVFSTDLSATKKRFVIAGLNQQPLPEGGLVEMLTGTKANAPARDFPMTLSNLSGSNPSGDSIPLTASEGVLRLGTTQSSRLSASAIRNAASLQTGPVAPGEIISVYGIDIGPSPQQFPASGPASISLGGVGLTFDGVAAPLLVAGRQQINAVVPLSVRGTATEVALTNNGRAVDRVSVPVVQAQPAIFALGHAGVGSGAVLNQDSTVNSPLNPAVAGSIVSLFATGGGRTNPEGLDGQPVQGILREVLTVSVKIGGKDAEVLYAGAAPELITGVLQVNCRIPFDVTPGVDVGVVLTVGDTSGPPGVTISIVANQ